MMTLGFLRICSVLLNLSLWPKLCKILLLHTLPVPQGKETVDPGLEKHKIFGVAARKIQNTSEEWALWFSDKEQPFK